MNARKTLVFLGLLVIGTQASANARMTDEQHFQLGDLELNVGLGLLSGKAEEKVYDPRDGKKISQLNWDISQATTLHMGLTYHPLEWLSVNVGGWTRIAGGNSHMKDYDWLDDDEAGWSHFSNHPDTRLDRAWQADISATVWALKRKDLALGVTAGYQRNELGWQSRGGSYTYSSDEGYRDISGTAPSGEKGISYRQTYDTPYIGLVGLYTWQDWTLESRFKYSQWVKARDYDQHYLRDLTFTGNNGSSGGMHSLALGLTYRVSPEMSLKAGFDYQVHAEAKGSVQAKHGPSGQTYYSGGDSGSQASRTLLSSMALTYHF